jgi:hypothetical protein
MHAFLPVDYGRTPWNQVEAKKDILELYKKTYQRMIQLLSAHENHVLLKCINN